MVFYNDVSTLQRLFAVGAGFLACITVSGSVLGYGSLKEMLLNSGVYAVHCSAENLDSDGYCADQIARLDLMYTVAGSALSISFFLVGLVLDRWGPRVTCCTGILIYAVGLVGFASSFTSGVDIYIPSFMLLAIGGPFVFMSTFQLSQAFPKYSSTIMSMMSCGFDASSITFFIFKSIHDGTGAKVDTLFYAFLGVVALVLVYGVTLMPKTAYSDKEVDFIPVKASEKDITDLLLDEDNSTSCCPLFQIQSTPFKERSLKSQLLSLEFIQLVVFMCIYMLRINFFIGSFGNQIQTYELSKAEKSTAIQAFGLLLPLGPFVSIWLSSMVIDYLRLHTTIALFTALFAMFGVASTVASLPLVYFGLCLFVLIRSMVYAVASAYIANVFGFKTFGRVYGTQMLCAGVFNLSQQLLLLLVRDVWEGEYWQVNLILSCVCVVVGTNFSVFLWRRRDEKIVA